MIYLGPLLLLIISHPIRDITVIFSNNKNCNFDVQPFIINKRIFQLDKTIKEMRSFGYKRVIILDNHGSAINY